MPYVPRDRATPFRLVIPQSVALRIRHIAYRRQVAMTQVLREFVIAGVEQAEQ